MRTSAQRLGDAAERMVARRLAADGWLVHARQVRLGRLEVDLIATDPGPPPMLVVVEVRWRSRRDFGLPEETLDRRKLARLRHALLAVGGGAGLPDGTALPTLPLRIDFVAVEPGERLRHHRNVG